jgi:hypothetical protein
LLGGRKTFSLTRSLTGHTHAGRHRGATTRTLLYDFHRQRQARFHTCPSLRGHGRDQSSLRKKGQQRRRVEISLHRADATRAAMPALRERLFDVALAAMTVLGEPGIEGRDFSEHAASFRNCAFELCYKHARGSESDTSAKAALPAFVEGLFDRNGRTDLHDLVRQSSMQALAVRCETALLSRKALACLLGVAALLPAFAPWLAASLLVVVLGIIGTALPVKSALEAAALSGIGAQLITEGDQACLLLLGDDRQGLRPDIQPDGVRTGSMLRLLVGLTFQNELD